MTGPSLGQNAPTPGGTVTHSSRPRLQISADDTIVDVDPDLGGGVLSFRVGGIDVLRPAPGRPAHALAQAMFVLLPWVNRIEGGRFFAGERFVTLAPNVDGEPHPLHGQAWLRPWDVGRAEESTVHLRIDGGGDEWPWPYTATHQLRVEPGRLDCELMLENTGEAPMPAGIGFHPAFERPARLTATVDGVWSAGADALPIRWEEREGFRATDIDGIITDETHTGWDGRAVIESPPATIDIASNLPMLHVFAGRGRNFFCIEPTSAAPDAVNNDGRGLVMLDPGSKLVATMRISARVR